MCEGGSSTNTTAVNKLSFCRVTQNPPIPPLVKGGEGGFNREFRISQCQICYCVRIRVHPEIDNFRISLSALPTGQPSPSATRSLLFATSKKCLRWFQEHGGRRIGRERHPRRKELWLKRHEEKRKQTWWNSLQTAHAAETPGRAGMGSFCVTARSPWSCQALPLTRRTTGWS